MARNRPRPLNASPPRRSVRRDLTRLAVAALLVLLVLAIAIGARDVDRPYLQREDVGARHVHAAAFAGGRLLIAGHYGLFAVPPGGGRFSRVGAGREDLTSLASDGGRIYASGNADATRPGGPRPLGLLTSAVASPASWRHAGGRGHAFDLLAVARGTVFGYDRTKRRLHRFGHDGGAAVSVSRAPADLDQLVADPSGGGLLLAVSFRGVYASDDAGRSWRRETLLAGPLAWPRGADPLMVMIEATFVREAGAWRRYGPAPGERPAALAASPAGDVYAVAQKKLATFVMKAGTQAWTELP